MKNLLLLLPVFLWLQACSQSPAPNAADKSHSVLTDTTGIVLGDSPGKEFRLFKFTRIDGDQTKMDLKLLRLSDLKEALVCTLPAEDDLKVMAPYPRYYWSNDSKFLVTENSINDSIYKREMVIFDLTSFSVGKRKDGNLLGFDPMNDVAFLYRETPERQGICYFPIAFPEKELVQEVLIGPSGRLPTVIIVPREKRAKVKAYMTDGVPVNFVIQY
ncbi:MAG: hypothetical protein Q7T20_10910 [Saprospiraceae bacterium]|nr:hypothetical protein [Saprospiraceae bacterium]